MKYIQLKTQFALSISSKVKCYKVNWKAIYDLLYLFHTNVWCTIHEKQPLERYVTLIWPINVIQGQRSQGQLKDHNYMTLYMCFIQTLVTACPVSEILAYIDNKGSNWTFLTLKITFKINQRHLNLRTALGSSLRSYMMQYIWAALQYYWLI